MSTPESLFYYVCPPSDATVDAKHQVKTAATSGAASNYDWVTGLGTAAPEGSCWLVLEASANDCYVRFKPTTSAAATTITNGLVIKAGQPGRSFYVDPVVHKVIDVIAAGVGTLQVQVSSPIGNRRNQ